MNLDNLFCENVKKIQNAFIMESFKMDYNLEDFDEDCKLIESCINYSYETDDEDIEDMGDLIDITNIILYEMIPNDKFSFEQISRMVQLRKLAKKKANQKSRDSREGRKFWNVEEAPYQYMELCQYIWHPSSAKLKELHKERFGDLES